nr:MAG TPA: hypothetical protein [Microviridae sp.]DAN44689.1 MAG TPA: hypothetical protein [Microviridae sp.]
MLRKLLIFIAALVSIMLLIKLALMIYSVYLCFQV